MSLENARKFLEQLKIDDELNKRVMASDDVEESAKIAKEAGFDCTREEIKEAYNDLSDADLDAISGGSRSHQYRGFV